MTAGRVSGTATEFEVRSQSDVVLAGIDGEPV